MEFTGIVRVKPGNTVAICQVASQIEASRQVALQYTQGMLQENPKGFDSATMQSVKPVAPFKPGTKDHWEDVGLHVCVAVEGATPWNAADGTPDKVTEEMHKIMDGREITVVLDANNWHYLEANPLNDEATKIVFYVAFALDKASAQKHTDLRMELGLGPMSIGGLPHLSLAGITPEDGDTVAFRKRFCRPRPTKGFPAPYLQLGSDTVKEADLKETDGNCAAS